MSSGIYTIVNGINGNSYIGSSVDIVKRWAVYKTYLAKGTHHSAHLQHSWNKYGSEAFHFRVLEECPVENLMEREQEYLDGFRPVYNVANVAGLSTRGTVRSEETKRKISESNLRYWATHDHPMKGVPTGPLSEEHRRKISLAQTGKVLSDAHKQKVSEALKGRKGISRPPTPRQREILASTNRGKRLSPEHRARISEGKLRYERAKREEKAS